MLKLAFDAKRAYQNYSGLGNYSRYVLETMIQMFPENEYYLYTPQVKIDFIDYLVEYRKQVHLIDITSLPKFIQPLWRNVFVPFDLKRKGIQLYHGLSNELPRGIHSSIPQIVTIHDLIFLKHPEWYNASDIRISEQKIKHACNTATKIIATSEHTKQDIINFYSIPEKKIEVVYQDCDARFHKRLSEAETHNVLHKYKIHQPYILSVGTIEERKNQILILKAFRKLKKNDLQLLLVGRSTSYIKEVSKYIYKHQLSDRVRILTDVTNDDLPLLYGGALFSVYASLAE
ncbi:MAG: glycosyltransferase family 4 protein, partial [Cytophagales bacterium]|nr:glycosyltransferase family 4 protein [Cytophaga sp.]